MEDSVRINNNKATDISNLQFGDLLVGYLNQLGIEYVYGVPGGAIEPLYDALARSESQGGREMFSFRL